MRKFLCGVPTHKCKGSDATLHKNGIKTHGTSIEAFKCYKNFLLSSGYKQVGNREFQRPGEPILVLSKKSKFGRPLRKGKTGEGMAKSSRYTHKHKEGTRAIQVV